MSSTATAQQVLRRLTRFQGITMAVVILVGGVSIQSYRTANDRVHDTETTLVELEQLRGEVLSAETGLRGYALVRRDEFLDPYEQAVPRIRDLAIDLRDRLPDQDQEELRSILDVFVDWRDHFAKPLLADLRTNDPAALAPLVAGQGKRRIDRIREDAAALAFDLRAEDAKRQRRADRIGTIGLAATFLGVLAILGIGGEVRRRLVRSIAGPLQDLADITERFGSGEMTARAYRDDGVAEVRRVASSFNAMADRTQAMVVDLMAVDRLKSEFVSVVSHELRTPLTSIRGSLGLLASGAMGEVPPDAAEMLQIATSNTDRLVRLINDILDLERIESGNEALDIRPLQVSEVLADAAASVQGTADAAGVRIEVDSLDLVIDGDADRLVQALTNLLGNAIKFSPPGSGISLEAEARGHQVVLRVTDHGRGIPPDMLEAVFERFQQVDASDAREKGGTGLGLAIVRSIADRHGGRVEVASELGEGSSFSVVLPAIGRVPAKFTPVPIDGSAVVVLVEDDPDLRRILGTLLGHHGIDVATAETAQEAIDCCRAALPDVLVLDVRLAEGDGYDVVKALRQDDRLRSLPTIVYTVMDLTPEQRDRLRLGETIFVAKGQRTDESVEQEVVDLLSRVRS